MARVKANIYQRVQREPNRSTGINSCSDTSSIKTAANLRHCTLIFKSISECSQLNEN